MIYFECLMCQDSKSTWVRYRNLLQACLCNGKQSSSVEFLTKIALRVCLINVIPLKLVNDLREFKGLRVVTKCLQVAFLYLRLSIVVIGN